MKNDVNKTIEDLKQDPIFNMSLSSKELFHSNFWAWLFERDKEYAEIFFPEIGDYNRKKVEREVGHRDVTLWGNNNKEAYVIENKFKSLPDLYQLLRYQEELEGKFKSGVITGLEKPDFMDKAPDWNFISYKEIGEKIKEVAEKESNGFEKELIIKYADLLCMLDKCIYSFLNHFNFKEKWLNNYVDFYKIRIADVTKKLNASQLRQYLKEKLLSGGDKLDTEIGDYKLSFKQFFSNGEAGVDICYEKENDKKLSIIGIQIQGNHYRWVVQVHVDKKLNDKQKNDFFSEYLGKHWFVDFNASKDRDDNKKVIKDHIAPEICRKTGLRNKFAQFNGKEDTFLYQYWNMTDYFGVDNIPFEKLAEQIKTDMRFAAEILKNNMKQ